MVRASLNEIVNYCDRILRSAEIEDYDGAVNGLQVENGGTVQRIAAAVDGTVAHVLRAGEHAAGSPAGGALLPALSVSGSRRPRLSR